VTERKKTSHLIRRYVRKNCNYSEKNGNVKITNNTFAVQEILGLNRSNKNIKNRSQPNIVVKNNAHSCNLSMPGAALTKQRALIGVRLKNESMLLQPLGWRWVECATHHEQDVRKE